MLNFVTKNENSNAYLIAINKQTGVSAFAKYSDMKNLISGADKSRFTS